MDATRTGLIPDARTALARSVGAQLADKPEGWKRNNTRYAAAQTNEKAAFLALLSELARTIPNPEQTRGRPRASSSDVLFAMVYKCYSGVSSRRFTFDLKDAQSKGYIEFPIHYNSLTRAMSDPSLTPLLKSLIEGVAASFAHVETNFAMDATGFRIPRIYQWYDAKYGKRNRREWLKCHAMVGVKSHIIASVQITKRNIMDHTCGPELTRNTKGQFQVKSVAADSAYSTVFTREQLESQGVYGAIPFKKNNNPFNHTRESTWSRMYHLFALNAPDWQEQVNRQNQAESTFSMIKRKFGEKVYSKSDDGQINEILCKVLCHNLCVVIYWLYQFGVSLPESSGDALPPLTPNLKPIKTKRLPPPAVVIETTLEPEIVIKQARQDVPILERIWERVEDGCYTPEDVIKCLDCGHKVLDGITTEQVESYFHQLVDQGRAEWRKQGGRKDRQRGAMKMLCVPKGEPL